jgi:trans-aconitate methyltransferase
MCDAGCGSGADVPALLSVAPHGRITAVDSHKPFIDELLVRVGTDPRVTAYKGNMAKLKGPFDLIWSAGALYFLGVRKGLKAWRPALAKGGVVAFSEPCLFTDTPSDSARAFWGDLPELGGADSIADRVASAGYETLATRRLSDAAWRAYFGPLQARIDALRPDADDELRAVLDAAQDEIDRYASVKDETGYLLSVVRPA